MLQHLSIKNYALIDTLELDLKKGLSVITGETGAGKSIILGALNLVLGKRADLKVLKDGTTKCIVEAVFVLNEKENIAFFTENDIDFEAQTIVRREILPSGKSRAFINDTPVTLGVVNQLAERVIDVHSQHQTMLLSDSQYQLALLDSFAKNEMELVEYQQEYQSYNHLKQKIDQLNEIAQNEAGDSDYINFLLNELNEARLIPDEQEEIEEELSVLEHAEEIQGNLSSIITISEGESGEGLRAGLVAIDNHLKNLSRYHKDYEELQQRVDSLRIEFEDIYMEVEQKAEGLDFEPERLEKLDTRLSLLVNLQKKHAVSSVEELIAKKDDLAKKVAELDGVEEELSRLTIELKDCEKRLNIKANALHESRLKATTNVEDQIIELLASLNMKTALFKIDVVQTEQYKSRGADDVKFSFTANKGLLPQALSKVASGGEMSRVMLALKAIMARRNNLPSIIFDEIDTGVSGETAMKIGAILKEMGASMQVIAITHLPQIAGMGQQHYKVVKELRHESTFTNILSLNNEERLNEVARLLSGDEISEAALANARTMLGVV
jgi:DNA repair protein RecN (Recombination protein N)